MSRERRMEPMGFGGSRVYVGDIGNRIGKFDLQREFEQYGQVLDVWMTPQHEDRFHEKKFAFVVFRYAEDAEVAVRDKNGRQVCGRKVRVEHAKPPRPQVGRNQDFRGGRGGFGGYSGRRGNYQRGGYQNMGNRQTPPRFNRYRSRSFSPPPRDNNRPYRRSPPPRSPPRQRRPQGQFDGNNYQDRFGNRMDNYNNYSPERRMKQRPPSYSPDDRSRQQAPLKRSRHESPSLSPSPPRKQKQQHLSQQRRSDSGSFVSRSPSRDHSMSPSIKKAKKRSRKQSRSPSPSMSPQPSPPRWDSTRRPEKRYSNDEGYEKPSKSHKSKKSKSKKKKKSRDLESGEDFSSDNGY